MTPFQLLMAAIATTATVMCAANGPLTLSTTTAPSSVGQVLTAIDPLSGHLVAIEQTLPTLFSLTRHDQSGQLLQSVPVSPGCQKLPTALHVSPWDGSVYLVCVAAIAADTGNSSAVLQKWTPGFVLAWSTQPTAGLDYDRVETAQITETTTGATVVQTSEMVFATGNTSVTLDGQVPRGDVDVFVARLSPADGTRVWSQMFGTMTRDRGAGLAVDAYGTDGGAVYTSYSFDTFDGQSTSVLRLNAASGRRVYERPVRSSFTVRQLLMDQVRGLLHLVGVERDTALRFGNVMVLQLRTDGSMNNYILLPYTAASQLGSTTVRVDPNAGRLVVWGMGFNATGVAAPATLMADTALTSVSPVLSRFNIDTLQPVDSQVLVTPATQLTVSMALNVTSGCVYASAQDASGSRQFTLRVFSYPPSDASTASRIDPAAVPSASSSSDVPDVATSSAAVVPPPLTVTTSALPTVDSRDTAAQGTVAKDSSALSTGTIIGIVVGVLLLLLAGAVAVLLYTRYRRQRPSLYLRSKENGVGVGSESRLVDYRSSGMSLHLSTQSLNALAAAPSDNNLASKA